MGDEGSPMVAEILRRLQAEDQDQTMLRELAGSGQVKQLPGGMRRPGWGGYDPGMKDRLAGMRMPQAEPGGLPGEAPWQPQMKQGGILTSRLFGR
jgi:hypothetical protein